MHRILGIGVALLILPVSLGATGVLMIISGAFWTAGLARIVDASLRYTIDKTSREVLFLPLPADLKYRAKPFIDVSVDRFAKGLGALLILVLIKDWGLGFDWRRLSYASLAIMVLWVMLALRARREYQRSFRKRLVEARPQDTEAEAVANALLPQGPAGPETIARLVGQLSDPDERVRGDAAAALGQLRVRQPEVTVEESLVERLIGQEAARAFTAFAGHQSLRAAGALEQNGALSRALLDKHDRSVERVFRLLSLVHPPGDIAAVQATLKEHDARVRSGAIEYLDNLLRRNLRNRVLVLVEDLPDEERIGKGKAVFDASERAMPEILADLARDADPAVSAAASALAAGNATAPHLAR